MRDDSIPSPPPQSFTWRSYAAQEEVVTYQILPPTSPHTLRMRIQTILDGFFNNPSEPEQFDDDDDPIDSPSDPEVEELRQNFPFLTANDVLEIDAKMKASISSLVVLNSTTTIDNIPEFQKLQLI
ncbi:hypothetical protein V9T40_000523 [Parthenolecanium corni]|uniref:Uncharacterized protein n=1 Tax=Parthenolecanium corni TaxID=536013 RepID=A0AAN9TD15_9HEMI